MQPISELCPCRRRTSVTLTWCPHPSLVVPRRHSTTRVAEARLLLIPQDTGMNFHSFSGTQPRPQGKQWVCCPASQPHGHQLTCQGGQGQEASRPSSLPCPYLHLIKVLKSVLLKHFHVDSGQYCGEKERGCVSLVAVPPGGGGPHPHLEGRMASTTSTPICSAQGLPCMSSHWTAGIM